MPAPLKITLTNEENKTLKELEIAQGVARRTKQRATALRLSASGVKVKAIAEYLEWAAIFSQRNDTSLESKRIGRIMGSRR